MSEKSASGNKRPAYKKWWFWVIIVIAIIGIGAIAGGSKNEPTKVGEGKITETDNQSNSNNIFKVGDIIKNGDYEITVKNVEHGYTSSNQFVKPADGKEYVRITVEIKNVSNDKKSYNTLDWQIEDEDGALESINLSGTGTDNNNIGSGELTAGGKKAGTLVFEVPKGQQNLKLHYKPMFSFDEEVVIEL